MIRKLNKINQVDFSNRIGISQATLSELEQDKYMKKKEIPDHNFSPDEIAYDKYKTNSKTKLLLIDGDIYIKEE